MKKNKRVTGRLTATVTARLKQTELEMEAGRKAVEGHSRKMARRKKTKGAAAFEADFQVIEGHDRAVKLPADVQATLARGEAAFKRQGRITSRSGRGDLTPRLITSIVDVSVQHRRDANLAAREQPPQRRRRQPPMTRRLQAVMIVVDRLQADGVPFGVGPNSRMNKAVRRWLNERASRSPDPRVSRRKNITPTAVRALLKQVKAEGQSPPRGAAQRKRTSQEEARERLREFRSRPASGAD